MKKLEQEKSPVCIKKIKLNNFRCFENQSFNFDKEIVLISGKNGSGKTSLLESIFFCSHLRSFRTNRSNELIRLDQEVLFLQSFFGSLCDEYKQEDVQIGCSVEGEKIVKINGNVVRTRSELASNCQAISLTAEDIKIVDGSPRERRELLHHTLMLSTTSFLNDFKKYKKILEHRNKILLFGKINRISRPSEELLVWSKSMWKESKKIRDLCRSFLSELETILNELLERFFGAITNDLNVELRYASKNDHGANSFDQFWRVHVSREVAKEFVLGRSTFGPHLDDFLIKFQQKNARLFASRGQQKLVVFLLKIAQLLWLQSLGCSTILLVDDFLTDFDEEVSNLCFKVLLDLKSQVFVASSTTNTNFHSKAFRFIKNPDENICLINL
jgi:DNA replication and repair protein RecF